MEPWGIVIGFITIFLTIIGAVWALSAQFSACRQDIINLKFSIEREREDRTKVDNQLQNNVDKCKEEHSRRLQSLEEIHRHHNRSVTDGGTT